MKIRAGDVVETPDKVYHIIGVRIYFNADSSQSLTVEKDKSSGKNFYWVNYQILFNVKNDIKEDDKNAKYYIYDFPLNFDGSEKQEGFIYDSNSDWGEEHIKSKIVTRDPITVKTIKAAFPDTLKGPELEPPDSTVYVNTNPSNLHTYSSEDFKKLFDNNFYVLFDPQNINRKELINPFRKVIPPKVEQKMSFDHNYSQAVKIAMEKKKSDKKPAKGYDIVTDIFRHPVPVKKQSKKKKSVFTPIIQGTSKTVKN